MALIPGAQLPGGSPPTDESGYKTPGISVAELNAMEKRCLAATEGPWHVLADDGIESAWVQTSASEQSAPICLFDYRPPEASVADATFTAHARADVPRLVAEVRALSSRVKDLLAANNAEVERRSALQKERDELAMRLQRFERPER
ncbi:MAG: hypothetical protein ABT940_00015 [Alphaproteobacteria bacterium]